MIDSHVHTRRCHHAQGKMEDYIKSGVRAGLTSICFLEHLTPTDVDHTASMAVGEIPAYLAEAHELKRRYERTIDVNVGLEIDFQPQYVDFYRQIVAEYPFDAIGSSIHTIDGIDIVSHGTEWHQNCLDTPEIVRLYWERLSQMVAADYFDFVCHLDLIDKFDHRIEPQWHGPLETILKGIKGNGQAVELNTSGMTHSVARAYPSLAALNRCRQLGIDITLSSDAHHPDHVGRYFGDGIGLLKSAGFGHIVMFKQRRARRVAI